MQYIIYNLLLSPVNEQINTVSDIIIVPEKYNFHIQLALPF